MISFVYFDVGGVIELDFSKTNKWRDLKKELGIPPKRDQEFENLWKEWESEMCVGRDTQSVLAEVKEKFNSAVPSNYSLLIDGYINRFEINKSIWPIIDNIRQKYRCGLLTNMYPQMFIELEKRGLIPSVPWEVVIDSSVVHLEKPDPRIFHLAQEKAGVKGEEIFFIDNTQGHLDVAQTLGWQTFLYDPSHPDSSSQALLEKFTSH